MYEARTYRQFTADNLQKLTVIEGESDLQVLFSHQADQATELVHQARSLVENAIGTHPEFLSSLTPLPDLLFSLKDDVTLSMVRTTAAAGVGPMAAVAGAVSAYVGEALGASNSDVLVENGGDLYIKTSVERNILIYAGNSPLSQKLAIKIQPEDTPLGICTSSGTVGHSLSFGKTDATVILSKDTALADAVATATGNIVKCPEDIIKGIHFAQAIPGILGVVIIVNDKIGVWGKVNLVKI